MSEYRELFDARGAPYNLANRLFPEARAEEAERLLAHCDVPDGARWLDVGAGGGYLAERAAAAAAGVRRAEVVGCDESPAFLAGARAYALRTVVEYGRLPFSEGAFAATGCLAVLHHTEEPLDVLREMLRVTSRGRRAAVGDVRVGSAAARFLNGFLDAHTEAGHAGRFYDPGVLSSLLAAAGGRDVRSEEVTVHWRFRERDDPRRFFRELFGLVPKTSNQEIEAALADLGLSGAGKAWTVPWTMVFASAIR